ncbi:MAG: N5-glutamine methyltransferase family protein [Gemmatimonadaceae bacterium]
MNPVSDGTELLTAVESRLSPNWTPLPDKPEETLELTARALWFAAAGDPRSVSRCRDGSLPMLDAAALERLWSLVDRRAAGTPLPHITERQCFLDLEMIASADALIPRRETELLARTAIERLRAFVGSRGAALAIDVCTGSGNVALALAAHDPRVVVFASDISAPALTLAERNATHLGLSDRVHFAASDLFAGMAGALHRSADIVTCNPPYITSQKVGHMPTEIIGYEPRLAFDGGAFGLKVVTRLLADAPRFLRPGASLCFEIGAGIGESLAERVRKNSAYVDVTPVTDDAGVIRVIAATVA